MDAEVEALLLLLVEVEVDDCSGCRSLELGCRSLELGCLSRELWLGCSLLRVEEAEVLLLIEVEEALLLLMLEVEDDD